MFDSLTSKQEKAIKDERRYQQNAMNQQSALEAAERIDDTIPMADQKDKEELVKWQQDLEQEKFFLRMSLRGLEVVNNEFVRVRPPIMNEMGISFVCTLADDFLDKNIINTNYDETVILTVLKTTCDDLATDLASNHEEYELNITDDGNFVMRKFKNIVRPAPYRALNDGERKHLRSFSKRVEGYMESGTRQEKKGWMKF